VSLAPAPLRLLFGLREASVKIEVYQKTKKMVYKQAWSIKIIDTFETYQASLTGPRGTKIMGHISYTLVSSPRDSTELYIWVESQIFISST
jgi:hypothetical protein